MGGFCRLVMVRVSSVVRLVVEEVWVGGMMVVVMTVAVEKALKAIVVVALEEVVGCISDGESLFTVTCRQFRRIGT